MSVVSYQPLHQYRTNPFCTPSAPDSGRDSETGMVRKTHAQLLAEGSGRVYVDNVDAVYSTIVSRERTDVNLSPFTTTGAPAYGPGTGPTVAVIGCGMGGLMTSFQLAKVGFRVTAFDAYQAPYTTTNTGNVYGAGRISPVLVTDPNTTTDNSAPPYNQDAQLGAMRFPSTSYLFWHYLQVAGIATSTEVFTEFPNPLKVPTAFSFGTAGVDGSVTGVWNLGGALPAAASNLQGRHFNAILNFAPTGSPTGASYTGPGGTMTVRDVANVIECKLAPAGSAANVKLFWEAARRQLSTVSYFDFLKLRGFTAAEINDIGYLGLGTGGFGPIFTRCSLEILRLAIWSYASEYAVPKLGQFPGGLYDRCRNVPGNPVTFRHNSPVRGIVHGEFNSAGQYVNAYRLKYRSGASDIFSGNFDYVVLAMTGQAAQRLLSTSEANITRATALTMFQNPTFPFYDSAKANFRSDIKRDLEGQNGMDSIKIFQTIYGPGVSAQTRTDNGLDPWLQANATSPTNTFDKRVRVAFGKYDLADPNYTPMGVTYILPMRTAAGAAIPFASSLTVMGLHYCWGAPPTAAAEWPNDTIKVSNDFLANRGSLTTAINTNGKFVGRVGSAVESNTMRSRILYAFAARFDKFLTRTGLMGGNPSLALARYFRGLSVGPGGVANVDRTMAIVHWSKVPYILMAFKLDRPGYGEYHIAAHKICRFANPTELDWDISRNGVYYAHGAVKKLYFAGCSTSNLGGWVEGAFQSALATCASIIGHAGAGGPNVGALSDAAYWPPVNLQGYQS